MLLRFRVANHRSIRAEHELSLVATEYSEGTARPTGVRADGRQVSVVPVAGIFGANASGKSNVVAAARAMQEAVRGSFAEWARDEGVPREPFALDPQAREETTLFEVDLVLGRSRVRYTYGFELSDERVEAEWLHAYPRGRRQVWFDREANRESGEEYAFPGEGLKGDKERLAEFTRPNSLFLTVGASLNHMQLGIVYGWFLNGLSIMSSDVDSTARVDYTRQLLTSSPNRQHYQRQIEQLLQVADVGVTGLQVDPSLPADEQVRLLHHRGSAQPVPLDFVRHESAGTIALFGYLGPVLRVLARGSVLVVDELDASLHPVLAAELIRLFQDQQANPRHAQLIFATHDVSLLGSAMVERPLDRDQVWITTKKRDGETELYPLIDARPRKEENLERGYLRGRYGGIPRVTTGELAREVAQMPAEAA